MRKILVALEEVSDEKIEQIKEHTGLPSLTAAVIYCIFETHRSLFPAYVTKKGAKDGRSGESKSEREDREQLAMCKELEGKVEGGTCVYYTYNLRKRYQQKVSLGLLNKELVAQQYQPSKKTVEKLKAEGKSDW